MSDGLLRLLLGGQSWVSSVHTSWCEEEIAPCHGHWGRGGGEFSVTRDGQQGLPDLARLCRGTWQGKSLGASLATPKHSGIMAHVNMSPWLNKGTSAPCFPPTHLVARRLRVRARGGEPVGAALHEPSGRPHQALAPAPAVAVLPLAPS